MCKLSSNCLRRLRSFGASRSELSSPHCVFSLRSSWKTIPICIFIYSKCENMRINNNNFNKCSWLCMQKLIFWWVLFDKCMKLSNSCSKAVNSYELIGSAVKFDRFDHLRTDRIVGWSVWYESTLNSHYYLWFFRI